MCINRRADLLQVACIFLDTQRPSNGQYRLLGLRLRRPPCWNPEKLTDGVCKVGVGGIGDCLFAPPEGVKTRATPRPRVAALGLGLVA